MSECEDCKKILRAWDKLEGDQNHSINSIQAWLMDDMRPAIKKLRQKLQTKEERKNKTHYR